MPRQADPPARVLVTGAGGFLGRRLLPALTARGTEVVGLDRPGVAPSPAAATWISADLAAPDDLHARLRDVAVDAVVHGGGISGPMVLADDPGRIWAVNVGGTAALLDALRPSAPRRMVLCSSMDVYGPITPAHRGEKQALDPDTAYGASKVASEALADGWGRRFGQSVIALRFGWIYGPGRTTQCSITDRLRAPSPPVAMRPDQAPGKIAPYLYVDDAVAAVLAALTASAWEYAAVDVAGPDTIAPDAVPTLVDCLVHDIAPPDGLLQPPPPLHRLRQMLGVAPAIGLAEGIRRLARSLQNA